MASTDLASFIRSVTSGDPCGFGDTRAPDTTRGPAYRDTRERIEMSTQNQVELSTDFYNEDHFSNIVYVAVEDAIRGLS